MTATSFDTNTHTPTAADVEVDLGSEAVESGVKSNFTARLAYVIAEAASFSERVDSAFFVAESSSNARDIEPRVKRWLETVAPDDQSRRAVLTDFATNGKALGLGFRTVRLRNLQSLPSWAQSLTAFIAAQSALANEGINSHSTATLQATFERAARAFIPCLDGRIEGFKIAEQGYDDVISDLVTRLIEICGPAIRFELSMTTTDPPTGANTPGIDVTQSAWLDRLERLPGLAFVIGVACDQWRKNVLGILECLRSDIPHLGGEPFLLQESDPLVEFRSAGDRHANGKSVTLLRFESGRGIVFKPKDLMHVEATMRVINFLNGAGLTLPLTTRRTLCREDYGWEERVNPAPVTDRDSFHRFYRRLGMLIRLMEILNARDLWADNLLAVGDQPVLVDLECLLSPSLTLPQHLPLGSRAFIERLETSVVCTAIPLQSCLPSIAHPARDVGCLSHVGDSAEAAGHGHSLERYRPWTVDETAEPWSHAADIIAGYREMHDVLLANRDELLVNDGPLENFVGVRMRYIWRSTPECHDLLRASISPTALVDGTARETVLSMILRDAYAPVARDMKLPEIAKGEIAAFRQLDVPLFNSLTTSRSLFTPEGMEIANYFAGTGLDEVRRRIAALVHSDIASDVAILGAAIDAARGGIDVPGKLEFVTRESNSNNQSLGRPSDRPRADEIFEALDEITSLLLGARCPPLGTGRGWLALLWWPVPEMWQVGPAGADLISGALGPALFLAEKFALSGDPQSWTASRSTLDELFELSGLNDDHHDPRVALGAAVPGGLVGPGALIYLAARLAELLGDKSLLHAAQSQMERAAACAFEKHVRFDFAFGLAGLQLELLKLRSCNGFINLGLDIDPLISKLTDRLHHVMIDNEVEETPLPLASRMGELAPLERDGVALALARTAAVVPELLADRSSLMASLAAHSFNVARRGGRLSALAVYNSRELNGSLSCAALHPFDFQMSQLSTRTLILRAEEAQFVSRSTGSEEAASEAVRCVRVLLDRRAATGRWFPDRLVDDRLNLSALDGMPALGLVLLRYVRPELPLVSLLQ